MLTLGCNSRLFSLLNRSSLHLNLRAFSSSSSDCTNQSRGGLPRFFSETLPPSKALSGGVVRVEGDEFWHMTRVLRLGINDRYDFISGTLKGGRADWLVEKCTELGASSVTPLLTERSQSISENRVDRLQRVILAAAKQSQRLHEMILKPPIVVGELLTVVAHSRLSFVAAAEATPVFNTLSSLQKEPSGVIIIGPEGDFTEEELNSIMEAGAIAVGLGPLRLRVETATLALLSALMLCVVLVSVVPCFLEGPSLYETKGGRIHASRTVSHTSSSSILSPYFQICNVKRDSWPLLLTPPILSSNHNVKGHDSLVHSLFLKAKLTLSFSLLLPTLFGVKMAIQLENLVESIKSKVRSLKKSKKPYVKMDKSASVKVEIRSRKARKLIDKTLKAADRPGKKQIP
ncbi:UNVERIFIED_CONTAM: hypothetical protein Scaly_1379600 [Sesamum calycinum]